MRWPFRRPDPPPPAPRRPHARRVPPDPDMAAACSVCGARGTAMSPGIRPLVCRECDTARSFDELLWEMEMDDR